ncbi:MAG: anaerobic sulfatase maturase [Oscillospiraceae bacterium]|nr:anaerobic sulfatase maturase [Oscillospiraceae bacterium]
MDTVSLLIKPASGRCNMRCRYCFYEDVTEHREESDLGFMTEETLEQMVQQAMEAAQRRVSFAFQGGEPMLRGLPFFRRFIELEERYRRPGLQIEHSIQTNGTLITQEWADFFRENRFLVGLSLDGTRELHNANRVDARGKGTWDAVVRSLGLLQKNQVDVNLLCVVTGATARRGQAVYQSLKKLGCRYMQFIPCLDPLEMERGGMAYSLSPQRYGQFLCVVFDQWYRDWAAGDYVSIRSFDDYVHMLAGQPAGTCATAGRCGQYFVVEGDGSVYPGDFFVLDAWRLGRLGQQSLEDLSRSPVAARFCSEGRGTPGECAGCSWLPLCNGGCRRDWVGMERNYHCQALRTFFEYSYPRMEQIARLERQMGRR